METRVCTRCLLRDMIEAGDSMEMIEKYRAAIKAADRVTEEVYERKGMRYFIEAIDRLVARYPGMKPEVDTQRKVEALFQNVTDEKDIWFA